VSLSVAVDFDGSLATGEPPQYRPGALEALAALKAAGHRLILHSCRCNPLDPGPTIEDEAARFYRSGEVPPRVIDQWRRFEGMRAFLQATGAWALFDSIWQAPGKPLADVYVDDRGEPPDWARIAAELGATTP